MISSSEYRQRRKHLMRKMKKRSIAILASAPSSIRNRDVEFPFRQSSDFLYLTGFSEPESVTVLVPGRNEGEFILFCRPFDETKAIWTGKHAGLAGAKTDFGADEAYAIEDLNEMLPKLMDGCERVYYAVGTDAELDHAVMAAVNVLRENARAGAQPPSHFLNLEDLLHEMRLFKGGAELAAMEKAAEISAGAHRRAMQICAPGLYEYQIEAEIMHEFMRHGLRSAAYPSIVAGGANACVLHYTENRDALRAGDLLLIDAGGECEGYAADITRTFPVSGKFSEPQRQIYELVLAAQAAAIELVHPGRRWNEPHDAAVQVLTKGLVKLGLLHGRVSKLIKDGAYKRFYMHRTGHWLGMDVHDVGDYKADSEWRTLEPGMVLTVEPGLYIAEDCEDIDPMWRGIGVRIEDDVLVTKHGCEILTAGVPKTVHDIEMLMGQSHA